VVVGRKYHSRLDELHYVDGELAAIITEKYQGKEGKHLGLTVSLLPPSSPVYSCLPLCLWEHVHF
jgi:hypothetical protein